MDASSRSPSPGPLAALLLTCALWASLSVGSCGGGADSNSSPELPSEFPALVDAGQPAAARLGKADTQPGAAQASARARRIWPSADLPEFVGSMLPALDAAAQIESQRKDAAFDDWPGEALHDVLKPALAAVLAALLADDSEALSLTLTPAEFESAQALRPADLETVLENGAARVLAADAQSLARAPSSDPALLLASAAALRTALAPAGRARAAAQIVSIEQPAPDRALTRALLQFDGGTPQAPVQINATWEITWALDPARIVALRVLLHQEVHAHGPFFADAGARAFGAVARWEAEFQHGVDDYFMRIDRRMGVAFQGMQGLAVGDIDNDGLEDIYVCQQVGLPNRLLVHQPDGTALERAAEAKVDFLDVTRSALIVDLDNDGNRDLVLAVANSIHVAYNNGQGVFTRQVAFPAEGAEQFYSLCAADPDGDGDLDIYGCRYALGGVMHGAPTPYHDADNGAQNVYLRNDGLGKFSDATEASGLGVNNHKFSLAALWEDFDNDGDLDLYVVNDFGRNNLYVNDGSGKFVDQAAERGVQDIGAGMGGACSDYDLDGDLDIYVTNMFSAAGLRTASQARFLGGRVPTARADYVKHARGNSLLRNRGDGTFEDVTEASGTALGRWAWGAKFLDFDSNGYDDLFVPNGQSTSRRNAFDLEGYFWRRVVSQSPVDNSSLNAYRAAFDTIQNMMMFGFLSWNGNERNNAYLNLGNGTFAEVSHVSATGFVEDSRSAAALDWDDDGREDLAVRNRTAPRLRLLLNRSASQAHFATFELIGRRCNRDAIGARVTVTLDGVPRSKRVTAGDGYLAQSSPRLVFGLGQATVLERVRVDWPDGSHSQFDDLAVDRHYRLDQDSDVPLARSSRPLGALQGASFPPNAPSSAPVDRVVLADPLPLAALEFPALDGPARRVDQFTDRLVFLHVWSGAHESGTTTLTDLAAAAEQFSSANVAVVCLTTDEGPALARARKTLADTPFLADAGYVDGRTREALSIISLEILGFFDRIPLPLSLLFDRHSRACVLYLGPPDPAQVCADALLIAGDRPRQVQTRKLVPGRWLAPPHRDLKALQEVFVAAGFEELGGYLGGVMEVRRGTPPPDQD